MISNFNKEDKISLQEVMNKNALGGQGCVHCSLGLTKCSSNRCQFFKSQDEI